MQCARESTLWCQFSNWTIIHKILNSNSYIFQYSTLFYVTIRSLIGNILATGCMLPIVAQQEEKTMQEENVVIKMLILCI